MILLQLDAGHAKQGNKYIRITRSFIVHFRHAILTQQRDREHPSEYYSRSVGDVEISNLWRKKAKPVHQETKAVAEKAQCSVLISPQHFAANKL